MQAPKTISIIGLGYVGLPLAVAFSKHFNVIGLDINQDRIDQLQKGIDITNEVNKDDLQKSKINFVTDPSHLKESNFHIVAVPTPVDNFKNPNMKALLGASETVGKIIKKGDIVVFESTVYPGVTEEICGPIIEKHSHLKAGVDFFLGYSPERVNPGDKTHTIEKIIKVVSAQTPEALEIVAITYGKMVNAGIHIAKSIKTAEAAKVIENIQRDVNIALINELSIIFDRLKLDTFDVLAAAQTKWNFLAFKPGLVGGHCIGVDPFYLTHKAISLGYSPQIILSGRNINDGMGKFFAQKMIKSMTNNHIEVSHGTITILGFTFKENVPDTRNTKVIDIIDELNSFGIKSQVIDPFCDENKLIDIHEDGNHAQLNFKTMKSAVKTNALILAVAHDEFTKNGWKTVEDLLIPHTTSIVLDIKGILDRNTVPKNIILVRP